MGGRLLSLSMSDLKSRQLKTRFQMCIGLLPSWGMGKSAGLKKSYLQIYLFLKFLLKTSLYVI